MREGEGWCGEGEGWCFGCWVRVGVRMRVKVRVRVVGRLPSPVLDAIYSLGGETNRQHQFDATLAPDHLLDESAVTRLDAVG